MIVVGGGGGAATLVIMLIVERDGTNKKNHRFPLINECRDESSQSNDKASDFVIGWPIS